MDAITERKALRILVILYPQSPLFASSEINAIRHQVLLKLQAAEADARTLFLATWPNRTILVFDLCNEQYDFAHAHHPADLPVLAVHLHTQEKSKMAMLPKPQEREVNRNVAQYHELHGYAALPIVEDHRNGNVPTYLNPRTIRTEPV